MSELKISLIIPTLNEAEHLPQLLKFLTTHEKNQLLEIIVVDGGSTDDTLDIIQSFNVKLIQSDVASRPVQLNKGANAASHVLLYFVHADVRLPSSFYKDITKASESYQIGGYRYQFDSSSWLLKVNAFFTRFPMMWCRGGDQTLFIKKSFFDRLGGYDEYYCVMEDFDLIARAKKHAPYYIIPKNVTVSARKYAHNSYLKVQLTNLRAFKMYNKGVKPPQIRSYYKKALGLADY